jgi:hypothetical protein
MVVVGWSGVKGITFSWAVIEGQSGAGRGPRARPASCDLQAVLTCKHLLVMLGHADGRACSACAHPYQRQD